MATRKRVKIVSQQDLLRDAMAQLAMTRTEFAKRISVPRRTLDKWLLPEGSADARALPEMARSYIKEILEWQGGKS